MNLKPRDHSYMNRNFVGLFFIVALMSAILSLSACQRNSRRLVQPAAVPAPAAYPTTGLPNDIQTKIISEERKPDSTLAYTHDISVEVGKEQLQNQMEAVRDACVSDKQAECTILNIDSELSSSLPSGRISMRLVPQKVSAIVNVATTNGRVLSSSTSAEDLAPELNDSAEKLASLNNYRDRLNSIMAKRDLNPDQLISIARELSNTQSQIDELSRDRSKLKQRVDTDLLTIHFSIPDTEYSREQSPITDALHSFGFNFRSAVAAIIDFTSYLIPWIPIILIALFGIRFTWRRIGKRSSRPTPTSNGSNTTQNSG